MRALLGWAVIAASACEGVVNAPTAAVDRPARGGTGGDDAIEAPHFECNSSSGPSPSDVRRLSRRELTNTLYELFGRTHFAAAARAAASLPPDTRPGHAAALYDTSTYMSDEVVVSSLYELIDQLTTQVTSSSAVVSQLFGDCFNSSPAAATCLSTFFRTWGLKILRRPLDADDVLHYSTTYWEAAARFDARTSLKATLMVMLQSAQSVFHTEWEGAPEGGNRMRLSSYEVAARLSYLVQSTGPDAELLAAAALPTTAPGSLASPEGLASQFERLVSTRRGWVSYDAAERADSEATAFPFDAFFGQWLGLEQTAVFSYPDHFVNDPVYAYSRPLRADGELRAASIKELKKYLNDAVWKSGADYRELMTSNKAFLGVSADLRALYGSGVAAPADQDTPVFIGTGERNGLLTHVALLASGLPKTTPFHRATTLLDRIWCAPMVRPDPNGLPDGALNAPPENPTMTTRERFEAKTASSFCQGCHSQINPLGFALEDFDGLGRHRKFERQFDAQGKLEASLPINSATSWSIDGEVRAVSGTAELGQLLGGSRQAQGCFVRQYFRFAYGREETRADGCSLAAGAEAMTRPGGTIKDMLRALVLAPDFQLRTLVDPHNP